MTIVTLKYNNSEGLALNYPVRQEVDICDVIDHNLNMVLFCLTEHDLGSAREWILRVKESLSEIRGLEQGRMMLHERSAKD